MNDTQVVSGGRRRLARLSTLLAVTALVATACSSGSSPASPAASTAPATAAPASNAPASAVPSAATKHKIGYMSLGEFIPFVKLVSDGILQAGKDAGQDVFLCDSNLDTAKALDCANQFKVQGVEGVLNFQVDQKSSPQICKAYGDLPTIAIDIIQPPCQIAFMGADNENAGKISGQSIGKYAKDTWNCDYTAYVSLESTAAGAANTARMGGFRKGFQEFCPIKNEKILDGADRTDTALPKVSDLLTALPGNRIVVVAINEDGIVGAIGAAKTAGRSKDLFYAGQGADPSVWKTIACDPQYIGTTAYYPERYGTLLIPAMIAKLEGGSIPENIFTKHELINSTNIRTIYPTTPAC